MTNDRIYRIQGYLAAVAAMAGLVGLSLKAAVVSDVRSADFIQLQYFLEHLDQANLPVHTYWISAAMFLGSLTIAILLERMKKEV